MSKLVLAALIGVMTLGFVASGSALAAPPRVHCTGIASVWDDTDVAHLTVPLGSGDDKIEWRARGHTTLNCGAGSPLTGQVAQIRQHVQARIGPGGTIRGDADTRINVAGRQRVFHGSYRGTTTVNAGTLSVKGIVRGVVDGNDFLLTMHEHGTINLGTKQWTGLYIDDIIIGLK